jgi:hypothetical protein
LKEETGNMELMLSQRVEPPPFEIRRYDGGIVELSFVFTKISPTCRRAILADCDAEAILISTKKHLRVFARSAGENRYFKTPIVFRIENGFPCKDCSFGDGQE